MWRARYRDADGKEHARHFEFKDNPRKPEQSAQHWLDSVTASVVSGTYLDPQRAKLTVGEWAVEWLRGYASKKLSTYRQAEVHLRVITKTLGDRPLRALRPSEVRSWVTELQEAGYATSTVYAFHRRLGQLYADAVHDGLVSRSPVSRRTSPPAPRQRPYVATTAQVWALHDALEVNFRPVVLLAAFAGLRVSEIAALRISDVDFTRGIISPTIQWPGEHLKTETSRTPVPIPQELALELNRIPSMVGGDTLVVGTFGRPVTPYRLEEAFRAARATVNGLPDGFRIHDLRHYFASLLIASGLDIKTVQKRMRHASAKTTLDIYGHMWPDKDESARAAVSAVLAERETTLADSMRTDEASAQ
jgi:integrase